MSPSSIFGRARVATVVATLSLWATGVARAEGPNDNFPSWSPDGETVVFCSDRSGDVEAYTVAADGSDLKRLTHEAGRDAHPSWSPDGGRIVFQSPRDGTGPRDVDLYLMAPDGSGVERLTHLDGFAGVPVFSPDGQRIVFQLKPAGDWDANRWQIWTMAADGSDLRQLTHDDADNQVPNLSPDGRHLLYFSNRSGGNQLWRMDSAGGGARQMTALEGEVSSGAYSPDGRRIAFVWTRPNAAGEAERDVYLMDAGGSTPERVTEGRQVWGVPFFSPGGDRLLINGVEDGRFVIDVAGLDGAPIRRLGAEAADTAEERGDRAFRERASGFVEHGKPDARPIDAALAAYEAAVADDPDNLRLIFKLLDSLYFKGYHVVEEEAEKRPIYQRMVDLTDRALERVAAAAGRADELAELPLERRAELERAVPGAAEAHYWAIAAWGLWGMTHHPLRALSKGVGSKVRDHARMLILIDERHRDAAGLRMLGRFHTEAPKVPLITGWIERREGLEMLRRAVSISRHDPRNLLFLAEAILAHDEAKRAEALALLREIADRDVDPEELVEHSESRRLARALLEDLERNN